MELSSEGKEVLPATNMLRPHPIGGDTFQAPALVMLALPLPGSVKAAPASAALIFPECEDLVEAMSTAPAVASVVIAATPAAAPFSDTIGVVIARECVFP